MKLSSDTYKDARNVANTAKRYVRAAGANFSQLSRGDDVILGSAERYLQIAVSPNATAAQMAALREAQFYGFEHGVHVWITVIE